MGSEPISPLRIAALLLQYPTSGLREALGSLEEGDLRGLKRERAGIERLLTLYATPPVSELERSYTETFDFSRQRSLHLTYHLHGDSRQRGIALLRLKQAYEAAGFELTATELPDYLPLMLEFADLAGPAGIELLAQHSISIQLIRSSLDRERSPWTAPLDAVARQLPGLSRREIAKLRRLAASGPPTEEVGLEPFAPPEIMGGDEPGGAPLPIVGGRS